MCRKLIITICMLFIILSATAANAQLMLTNRIVGISGAMLTNAENLLKSKQDSLGELNSDKIQKFYQETQTEIKSALEPYGYFSSNIRSEIFQRGNNFYINYFITEGKPVRITKIDVQLQGEGASLPALKNLITAFPLHKNDIFNSEQYDAAKKLLFTTAADNGYLDAVLVKKEVKINVPQSSAEITLYFDTGMRYYFGNVKFSQSPFSAKFLNKFVNFQKGEPYSEKKVGEFYNRLSDSGFFQEVIVDKEGLDKTAKEIPVDVDLITKKAKQYTFGLGYGTDTGVRGLLGLELRHVTSDGQSFKSSIKASEVESDIEAHYLIPGKDPTKDLYDLGVAYQAINQDFGSSHSFNVSAGYITMLQKWQQTIKLTFGSERYQINDDPKQNSFLVVPSIGWLRSETDNLIKPNKGYTVNFKIQGASSALGSTTSFMQGYFNGKYIYPLTNSTPLVLRAAVGYTAMSDLENLPLSYQYFAGGMQSIRGYSYNAIGPGRDLTVGSIEVRQRTIEDLYAVIFLDAGNATESFMPELKKSVGVGMLYRSPVGLIQLSYAKTLNEEGHPGKVQFSIGPEF